MVLRGEEIELYANNRWMKRTATRQEIGTRNRPLFPQIMIHLNEELPVVIASYTHV